MRKVNGADITFNELKKCYFGYMEGEDFTHMVDIVECHGYRYAITESCDAIVRYPIDVDSDGFVDYFVLEEDETLTIYDFIEGYWDLDEYNLKEFIFYFSE